MATITPPAGQKAPAGGVIVAITDYLGLQPWTVFAAPCAAKAAQIHLVKELARAWAPDGVRVCGVAPGPVDLEDDEHRAATLRAAARVAAERLVTPADVRLVEGAAGDRLDALHAVAQRVPVHVQLLGRVAPVAVGLEEAGEALD